MNKLKKTGPLGFQLDIDIDADNNKVAHYKAESLAVDIMRAVPFNLPKPDLALLGNDRRAGVSFLPRYVATDEFLKSDTERQTDVLRTNLNGLDIGQIETNLVIGMIGGIFQNHPYERPPADKCIWLKGNRSPLGLDIVAKLYDSSDLYGYNATLEICPKSFYLTMHDIYRANGKVVDDKLEDLLEILAGTFGYLECDEAMKARLPLHKKGPADLEYELEMICFGGLNESALIRKLLVFAAGVFVLNVRQAAKLDDVPSNDVPQILSHMIHAIEDMLTMTATCEPKGMIH